MDFNSVYDDLLSIVPGYGVDVDAPLESRQFFEDICKSFTGTRDEFFVYLEQHMPIWFKCIGAQPKWLQNPEWQFDEGKPMVFVGQVDIPVTQGGYFHDNASFFVFWSPEWDTTRTVIQVC